jgi:hypothetical protein
VPTERTGPPTVADLSAALDRTPGFPFVPAPQRALLLKRLDGGPSDTAASTRAALDQVLRDASFVASSPAAQGVRLQTFVTGEEGLPEVVPGRPDEVPRRSYSIPAPTSELGYGFASGAGPATRYDVVVGSTTVPVHIGALPQGSPLIQATIEDIAKALATVPAESLAFVKDVAVEPQQNPYDAYWATTYNTPGFRSYMVSGASGQISVFPQEWSIPQEEVDSSLIHETGHVFSLGTWGETHDSDGWKRWSAAADNDGSHVSNYARDSIDEDFAESVTLYAEVKGTPEEANARKLYSNRFDIIDGLIKSGGRS